jgi:hypothetical protein
MKKDLTAAAPELVEAGWQTIVAAEEALNVSLLRTLLVCSTEGRIVACGKQGSVARVIKGLVAYHRAIDESEKRLVKAAEGLRRLSGAAAYVLSMGDGFILTCGEAGEVAHILDTERDGDEVMPALQVFERTRAQRLTM